MALLDLQAMELSAELSGGYEHDDHCCGSGISLLLCG
ncbi:MAG TPA: SapB/AmfS family lanthipeptide [Pseudonocardiaceae bacterium]